MLRYVCLSPVGKSFISFKRGSVRKGQCRMKVARELLLAVMLLPAMHIDFRLQGGRRHNNLLQCFTEGRKPLLQQRQKQQKSWR